MGVPVVFGGGKYYFGGKVYKSAGAAEKAGAKKAWLQAAAKASKKAKKGGAGK